MRGAWILVLLLYGGGWAGAIDSPAPYKIEGLRLQVIPDQSSYELGTPVTATLRYTYTGRQPVVVHYPLNDIDRMEGLKFAGIGPTGKKVADPLPFWLGISYGQHFDAEPLGPGTPHEEKVILGQWLLFDQPGRYSVTVESTLAALNEFHLERDPNQEGRIPALVSDPLVITITPPVEAHRVQILNQAGADLTNPNHLLHWPAMKRLRYLRDARAIPLLIAGLDDPEDGSVNFEGAAGLYALPDQQQVKSALLKHVDEVSEPPPIYAQWTYASLLARTNDIAPRKMTGFFKITDPFVGEDMVARQKWSMEITDRLSRKVMENTARQSAEKSEQNLVQELRVDSYEPTPTLEQKRFLLDHAEALKKVDNAYQAAQIVQDQCKDQALVPNLKAVASNSRVQPEIRSAAMLVLHDMGHDGFRDVIANDLMSPKPQFSDDAQAMIGKYRQAEIGRALLKLLEDPSGDVAESAADRILDFGDGISTDDLDRVLQRLAKAHGLHDSQSFRAVYALALKSPKRAVALIQQIANVEGEYNSIHDPVLCRIEEGRPLVLKALRIGNNDNRTAMLNELQQELSDQDAEVARKADRTHSESWPDEYYDEYAHTLSPDAKLVDSYAPEFLRIAKTEPNDEARMIALDLLAQISGIPRGYNWSNRIHPEEVGGLLPQWQAWSAKRPGDS